MRQIYLFFLIFLIQSFCFDSNAYKVNWELVSNRIRTHLSKPEIDVKNARIEIYNFESRLVYQLEIGSFSRDNRIPIMSGSKWLTGAIVMSLVEDGLLDLDAPVTKYIDQNWIELDLDFQKTMINVMLTRVTVRQLLALTAAFPDHHDCISSAKMNMNQCSGRILESMLSDERSYRREISFSYGDTYYTLLGSIIERLTGKSFPQVFEERIGRPLGISLVNFYAKPRKKAGQANPRPAAGALMSVSEYERFMRMLSNKGRYLDKRILKRESIKSISADQVSYIRRQQGNFVVYGKPKGFRTYGFGNFVSCLDSFCRKRVNSSPGLNGFTPFMDFDRGYYAIIGVFKNDPQMSAKMRPLQEELMRYLSNSSKF